MLETLNGFRIESLKLYCVNDVVNLNIFCDSNLHRLYSTLTFEVTDCETICERHCRSGVILCFYCRVVHKLVGSIKKFANVSTDVL